MGLFFIPTEMEFKNETLVKKIARSKNGRC